MKWHHSYSSICLIKSNPATPVLIVCFSDSTSDSLDGLSARHSTFLKEAAAEEGNTQNLHHKQPGTQHHGVSNSLLSWIFLGPRIISKFWKLVISNSKTHFLSFHLCFQWLISSYSIFYVLLIYQTLLDLVCFISTLENWWPFSLYSLYFVPLKPS